MEIANVKITIRKKELENRITERVINHLNRLIEKKCYDNENIFDRVIENRISQILFQKETIKKLKEILK